MLVAVDTAQSDEQYEVFTKAFEDMVTSIEDSLSFRKARQSMISIHS